VRLRCQRCRDDQYPLDHALGLGVGERMTLGGEGAGSSGGGGGQL